MKKKKVLIYCALMPEAKPLVGALKLVKKEDNVFENDDILLLVGGMGLLKTKNSLEDVFKTYEFEKAINIGICGCVDKKVEIGELFCTNHMLEDIPFATLKSFENPVTCKDEVKSTLVDMEADAFLSVASLHVRQVFVFKIVSDHLDATIPTKAHVNQLMQKNIKKIIKYV